MVSNAVTTCSCLTQQSTENISCCYYKGDRCRLPLHMQWSVWRNTHTSSKHCVGRVQRLFISYAEAELTPTGSRPTWLGRPAQCVGPYIYKWFQVQSCVKKRRKPKVWVIYFFPIEGKINIKGTEEKIAALCQQWLMYDAGVGIWFA